MVHTDMATIGVIIITVLNIIREAMATLTILRLPPNIINLILTTKATIPRRNMALVEVAIVDGNFPALFR